MGPEGSTATIRENPVRSAELLRRELAVNESDLKPRHLGWPSKILLNYTGYPTRSLEPSGADVVLRSINARQPVMKSLSTHNAHIEHSFSGFEDSEPE